MSKLKKYGAVLIIILLVVLNAVVAFSQVPSTEEISKHAEGFAKYGDNYLVVPFLGLLAFSVGYLFVQMNKKDKKQDQNLKEQYDEMIKSEREKTEEIIEIKRLLNLHHNLSYIYYGQAIHKSWRCKTR